MRVTGNKRKARDVSNKGARKETGNKRTVRDMRSLEDVIDRRKKGKRERYEEPGGRDR